MIANHSCAHKINQTQLNRKSIAEIYVLSELFSFITHDTVIFVDLDNTLIMPSDQSALGSDQWFHAMINHFVNCGLPSSSVMQRVIQMRNDLFNHINFKSVEETTSLVFKTLRNHDIPCFIFTSRGSSVVDVTEDHLRSLLLDVALNLDFVICRQEHRAAYFKNGVIYCGGLDKGMVLRAFLEKYDVKKKRILCIDDNLKNLQAVDQWLVQSEFQFMGLQYTFLSEYAAAFNFQESLLEMMFIPAHLPSQNHNPADLLFWFYAQVCNQSTVPGIKANQYS